MQVSPFSSMVTKGHFSWHAFLNVSKCLPFAGDSFEGAGSIDSAMLSLIHKTFFLWCPDSNDLLSLQLCGCNVLFWKLRRNFFCFLSFAQAQSTSKSKSTYFCLSQLDVSKSGFSKFQHKSFSYSLEKSERPFCLLLFFR